jgi:predicted transcriptional regulator
LRDIYNASNEREDYYMETEKRTLELVERRNELREKGRKIDVEHIDKKIKHYKEVIKFYDEAIDELEDEQLCYFDEWREITIRDFVFDRNECREKIKNLRSHKS